VKGEGEAGARWDRGGSLVVRNEWGGGERPRVLGGGEGEGAG